MCISAGFAYDTDQAHAITTGLCSVCNFFFLKRPFGMPILTNFFSSISGKRQEQTFDISDLHTGPYVSVVIVVEFHSELE